MLIDIDYFKDTFKIPRVKEVSNYKDWGKLKGIVNQADTNRLVPISHKGKPHETLEKSLLFKVQKMGWFYNLIVEIDKTQPPFI